MSNEYLSPYAFVQLQHVSAGMVIFVNEKHHCFLAVYRTGNKARIYLERLKAGDVEMISALTNGFTEILS